MDHLTQTTTVASDQADEEIRQILNPMLSDEAMEAAAATEMSGRNSWIGSYGYYSCC
jgi:hypothetical protein